MIMMPGSGAGVRDGGAGGDGAPVQLPLRPGPGLVPQTDPSVKLYTEIACGQCVCIFQQPPVSIV